MFQRKMRKYNCNVEEPYFGMLCSGNKTVEGKVRKGKWGLVDIGDILCCSSGCQGTVVEFEVMGLAAAPTFDKLYEQYGSWLLPEQPATAWEVYSRWFSLEDETAYGVIGVELRRVVY